MNLISFLLKFYNTHVFEKTKWFIIWSFIRYHLSVKNKNTSTMSLSFGSSSFFLFKTFYNSTQKIKKKSYLFNNRALLLTSKNTAVITSRQSYWRWWQIPSNMLYCLLTSNSVVILYFSFPGISIYYIVFVELIYSVILLHINSTYSTLFIARETSRFNIILYLNSNIHVCWCARYVLTHNALKWYIIKIYKNKNKDLLQQICLHLRCLLQQQNKIQNKIHINSGLIDVKVALSHWLCLDVF